MSDPRYDPSFPQYDVPDDYNPRVQWAAVGVLLLLVGGIILASMFSGGDNQVASNTPAAQTQTGTTGMGGGPAQRPLQRP